MHTACASIFVLVLATAAAAQVDANRPVRNGVNPVASPAEYREFTSKINGRQYATWVCLPDSYTKDASRRFPVVYVTDGHLIVPLISSIYREMYLGDTWQPGVLLGRHRRLQD